MDCRRPQNLENCACQSADCPRKGACCECVAYHRDKGNLPVCLRSLVKPEEK